MRQISIACLRYFSRRAVRPVHLALLARLFEEEEEEAVTEAVEGLEERRNAEAVEAHEG